MYRKQKIIRTGFNINQSNEGETIETKIKRITVNKEPIKDGARIIFTERKDGVQAAYNIRTDRFDVALDAMDKVSKTRIAFREKKIEVTPDKNLDNKNLDNKNLDNKNLNNNGKPDSVAGNE